MTFPSSLIPTSLANVPGKRLVDFASGRGWMLIPGRRTTVTILSKPGIKDAEIAVPIDMSFGDYANRMLDAMRTLADVESIEVEDLYKVLALSGADDVVKWRRDSPEALAGTVLIDDGISFFEGAKKAFLASAHTALDPERFYKRMSRHEAEAFVKQCRMGPTGEGSFIATFFCPMDVITEKNKDEHGTQNLLAYFESAPSARMPFGRQVTINLVRQVARLAEAAAVNDGELLVKTTRDDPFMVSGNFCDAILQMATDSLRELSVSVAWSISPPPGSLASATLLSDHLPAVERFAKELRPVEEMKPERFIGKIGTLKASPEREKRAEGGEVTLHTNSHDGAVRARLHLDEANYQRAINAHDIGVNVSVVGILERRPGGAAIVEPHDFELLGESLFLSSFLNTPPTS